MRRVKKLAATILAAASLILGLDAIAVQEAAATPSPACAEELHLAKPTAEVAAAQTPALLVHGLGSDAGTWAEGTPSMKVVVDQIEGVRAVTFDYKPVNDRWVTDPAIGQKLAKTVVCYSKLYDKKVILVAHSMGGLASEEALGWAAYGTFAKDVTSHVVTIATPHQGSLLANAEFSFWMGVCNAQIGIFSLVEDTDELCRQSMADKATAGLRVNAEQAAKLPKFPSDVSVKAIAGDVRGRTCVVWGCGDWRSTGGDLVVSVKSATAQYTTTGRGDGKKVFACNTDRPVPKFTNAWCEHSNLLRAPQVQAEVKRSIQEHLTAARLEQSGGGSPSPVQSGGISSEEVRFRGLHLRLPVGWHVISETRDAVAVQDTTDCRDVPNLFGCLDFTIVGDDLTGFVESYTGFCKNSPTRRSRASIGSVTAQLFTTGPCTNRNNMDWSRHRVWHVPGRLAILAIDERGRGMRGLENVLANATWS